MSSQCFPSYNNEGEIRVKLDLSNYVTKTDLKNISKVDVSDFALKTNLASLKAKYDSLVNKYDTEKLDLEKRYTIQTQVVWLKSRKTTKLQKKVKKLTKKTKKTTKIRHRTP